MSKYDELKQRIQNVTGWTKEADDLIQKIGLGGIYELSIPLHNFAKITIVKSVSESIADMYGIKTVKHFGFSNQCEKLEAFKQSLTWLLDHSDIKKSLVGQEVKADKRVRCLKLK